MFPGVTASPLGADPTLSQAYEMGTPFPYMGEDKVVLSAGPASLFGAGLLLKIATTSFTMLYKNRFHTLNL